MRRAAAKYLRRIGRGENPLHRGASGIHAALAAELHGHRTRGRRGERIARTGDERGVKAACVDLCIERGHIGESAERGDRDDHAHLACGVEERVAKRLRLGRLWVVRAAA